MLTVEQSREGITGVLCPSIHVSRIQAPKYQRSFEWEEITVVKFVDDCSENSRRNCDWCLDRIIICLDTSVKSATKQYNIIDGQHRFIMLAIIIKVLSQMISIKYKQYDLFEEILKRMVLPPQLELTDIETQMRTKYGWSLIPTLSPMDATDYKDYGDILNNKHLPEATVFQLVDKKTHCHICDAYMFNKQRAEHMQTQHPNFTFRPVETMSKLLKAYYKTATMFKDLSYSDIETMCNYIFKKPFIPILTCDDLSQGPMLFNNVNSCGQTLSASANVKNLILSFADPPELQDRIIQIVTNCNNFIKLFTDKPDQNIYRVVSLIINLSINAPIKFQSDSLPLSIKRIRDHFSDVALKSERIDLFESTLSKLYNMIEEFRKDDSLKILFYKSSKKLHLQLWWYAIFPITYYDREYGKKLLRCFIHLMVYDVPGKIDWVNFTIVDLFANIIKSYQNQQVQSARNQILTVAVKYTEKYDIYKSPAQIKTLWKNKVISATIRRWIMIYYEMMSQTNAVSLNFEHTDVDHIIAQKISQKAVYTNRLGNLLLLESEKNRSAKDKPVDKKLDIYRKSALLNVKEFVSRYGNVEFKDEDIEERSQIIASKIVDFAVKNITKEFSLPVVL